MHCHREGGHEALRSSSSNGEKVTPALILLSPLAAILTPFCHLSVEASKTDGEKGEEWQKGQADEAMSFASKNSALIVEALWQTSLLDIEFTLRKCIS
jgi:hypothetical protein